MRILKPLPGALPMPERNLVGDWLMNSLGDKIFDLSGNGLHSSAFGGNPSWVPGKFGPAIDFDGDDSISVPDQAILDISGDITLCARIKYTMSGGTGSPGILAKDNTTVGEGYSLNLAFADNAKIRCSMRIGGIWESAISVNYNDDKWHAVVATYDGTNLKLYVDSVLEDTEAAAGAIAVNIHDLKIGWQAAIGAQNYFIGQIDNPIIFNRALSASEIAKLYREPFYRYPESRVFAVA